MLQLPNSPIFEGQEKKTLPIRHLHAGSELSPPFFLMALQTNKLGDLCLGALFLRWEDYFSPSARWLMAEMICEKKNRATFEATNVRTVPRE